MVVDYRALYRVTERRYFIISNADGLKSTVAGSRYISIGNLKEGFNQGDREPETANKIAVFAASGCCVVPENQLDRSAAGWEQSEGVPHSGETEFTLGRGLLGI